MEKRLKEIYLTLHKPTGAEIPVEIKKIDENNIIIEYKEITFGRKGFTLNMLLVRWNKDKDKVLEILQNYKVPGHINHQDIERGVAPADAAFFFEEYVYGIEQKSELSHSKLKPRLFKIKGK